MNDWLLIAHGSRAGRAAYAPLVDALAERLGRRPALGTLDGDGEPPRARRALALFLCAGAHAGEAEALAAHAGARLVGAPPPELVAGAAAAAAEAAFGRRSAVLFLVHDWANCEALVAELYARTRVFTDPVLAAWRGRPSLGRVLARWREDVGKPLAVQPVFVADGAWRPALLEAAEEAGVPLEVGSPLGGTGAFADALAAWMQEVE